MLLVVLLVYLALKLSLDVLLGAFAAGVVVRLFIRGEDREQVDSKLPLILVITTIGVDEQKMRRRTRPHSWRPACSRYSCIRSSGSGDCGAIR
jgi:hypothetical protein